MNSAKTQGAYAVMVDFGIEKIDKELQRRIDAEVEARAQKEREDMDQSIALIKEDMGRTIASLQEDMTQLTTSLSDPGTCPFVWIERCGRKSCADISICVNCPTARNFVNLSPTYNDLHDAKIAQAVKSGLTANGVKDMVASFLQGIAEQLTSTVVTRDIEEIPTNELQIIKVLTEIADKLEKEEDETYNSEIAALINDITQAIC